jgi:hypothetical protein
MATLNAASQSLTEGNTTAARQQLTAFLHQILALNQSGRLDDPTTVRFEDQIEALLSVLP